jgi:hypothetical protein
MSEHMFAEREEDEGVWANAFVESRARPLTRDNLSRLNGRINTRTRRGQIWDDSEYVTDRL